MSISPHWPTQTTQAPPLLRRRADDAPAPFRRGEFASTRRAMAIELVLEAQEAELDGASPELVEALREKARSVLGLGRDVTTAPALLALRRSDDVLLPV